MVAHAPAKTGSGETSGKGKTLGIAKPRGILKSSVNILSSSSASKKAKVSATKNRSKENNTPAKVLEGKGQWVSNLDRIVQRQLFADTVKHSEESRKSLKDLEKGRNKKEGRIQVTTAPKDPPGAGAAGSQGRKEAGGREESEERGEPSKNPGKAGGSQKGDGDGGGEEDGGEDRIPILKEVKSKARNYDKYILFEWTPECNNHSRFSAWRKELVRPPPSVPLNPGREHRMRKYMFEDKKPDGTVIHTEYSVFCKVEYGHDIADVNAQCTDILNDCFNEKITGSDTGIRQVYEWMIDEKQFAPKKFTGRLYGHAKQKAVKTRGRKRDKSPEPNLITSESDACTKKPHKEVRITEPKTAKRAEKYKENIKYQEEIMRDCQGQLDDKDVAETSAMCEASIARMKKKLSKIRQGIDTSEETPPTSSSSSSGSASTDYSEEQLPGEDQDEDEPEEQLRGAEEEAGEEVVVEEAEEDLELPDKEETDKLHDIEEDSHEPAGGEQEEEMEEDDGEKEKPKEQRTLSGSDFESSQATVRAAPPSINRTSPANSIVDAYRTEEETSVSFGTEAKEDQVETSHSYLVYPGVPKMRMPGAREKRAYKTAVAGKTERDLIKLICKHGYLTAHAEKQARANGDVLKKIERAVDKISARQKIMMDRIEKLEQVTGGLQVSMTERDTELLGTWLKFDDNESVRNFFRESYLNEQWAERKNALTRFLESTLITCSKKDYIRSMLESLFSEKYLQEHNWGHEMDTTHRPRVPRCMKEFLTGFVQLRSNRPQYTWYRADPGGFVKAIRKKMCNYTIRGIVKYKNRSESPGGSPHAGGLVSPDLDSPSPMKVAHSTPSASGASGKNTASEDEESDIVEPGPSGKKGKKKKASKKKKHADSTASASSGTSGRDHGGGISSSDAESDDPFGAGAVLKKGSGKKYKASTKKKPEKRRVTVMTSSSDEEDDIPYDDTPKKKNDQILEYKGTAKIMKTPGTYTLSEKKKKKKKRNNTVDEGSG